VNLEERTVSRVADSARARSWDAMRETTMYDEWESVRAFCQSTAELVGD